MTLFSRTRSCMLYYHSDGEIDANVVKTLLFLACMPNWQRSSKSCTSNSSKLLWSIAISMTSTLTQKLSLLLLRMSLRRPAPLSWTNSCRCKGASIFWRKVCGVKSRNAWWRSYIFLPLDQVTDGIQYLLDNMPDMSFMSYSNTLKPAYVTATYRRVRGHQQLQMRTLLLFASTLVPSTSAKCPSVDTERQSTYRDLSLGTLGLSS